MFTDGHRALKTKHETPKYGLIYHASLIGQAAPKFKGKISRVLAAKCSLSIRVDALGESADATIGLDSRSKVGRWLGSLQPLHAVSFLLVGQMMMRYAEVWDGEAGL